jgi:pimeloyl-ACP methyl ester carboxylesterase
LTSSYDRSLVRSNFDLAGEVVVALANIRAHFLGAGLAAGAAFAMGIASAASAPPPPPPPPAIDASLAPYASIQDSARLPDGRTIHMVCMGKGTPVVVLTAGLGAWSSDWNKVQPEVAEKTRVCAWDRTGWGMSSPSPRPPTADNRTSDLQAALKADGIGGPYVVVGHSLGGYESLLLKDREPSKVVGMVLVDPSFPGQIAAFKRVAPTMMERASGPSPLAAYFLKCAADVRAGTVWFDKSDPNHCMTPPRPPSFPPELRAALDKAQFGAGPQNLAGLFENQAFYTGVLEIDSKAIVNPGRNYGDMPLVVLTAGVLEPAPDDPDAIKKEIPLEKVEWLHGHDALAALSTQGVNRIVPDTTHNIQQLKPQAVIDAIDEVVDQARASQR